MQKVGVRDLKNNLSAFLRRVASGEVIQVTDHGRVIAELRQPLAAVPASGDLTPRFWEMVARGEVKLATEEFRPNLWTELPRPEGIPEGSVQRFIAEDRGD